MKKLNHLLIVLFLIPLIGFSQTRTDSIAGTYSRHFRDATSSTLIIPQNTDEKLILDKNHCAALTVIKTNPVLTTQNFTSQTEVYYGIWRVSGDSIIITYTKTESSPSPYTYSWTPISGIVKLDPSIQHKYFWTGDNYLEPITETEKSIFYKGELEMVE